jgi:excisionase family DNA binding protein
MAPTTDGGLPCTYTPEQVRQILHLSTTETVYKLLNSGELGGVKVGSLWRISQEHLNAFLGSEPRLDPMTTAVVERWVADLGTLTEKQRDTIAAVFASAPPRRGT